MAFDAVKGELYRVYLDLTTPGSADVLLGCAQEVSISMSVDEIEEPLCAEDYTPGTSGTWKKPTPGDKGFSFDVSGLVIPTNSANIQQFHDAIDNGTLLSFKIELLDDVAPAPDPTVLKEYTGKAWISAHDVSASNDEFSTYSVTFTGYDKLSLATPA